ncbi:Gp138 family membrane-puncturing spike protein [Arsenophonus apicola]|uniref:Gp138 family membrane-puncturing spike protein n=1 Tax=Arsenophonus apicola TaxID=2879119 RepID=A0ABY8P0W5_9GAMM|nr:Gp138 family membrane-puncturing spike protein [Arsenophonus apicola]WGO83132.1 Gp138 family membrane-puncturing spike protein [Arsenophonus apicola]WGO84538.1 Gp138 family membrane-puncturing spike protein [Arsenophonus apicola]
MAISVSARTGDQQHLLEVFRHTISSQLRVAMPGIVQSFDASKVTCVVQPAIKGVLTDSKGNEQSVNLPLLVDVPVVFPRGGGVTMTFPIKSGDECLVVFADRCIDFWWQNGGIQEAIDPRQHDLSDAFAFIGPQSQAKTISNINENAMQLRSDDGTTYFEVNPTTQKMKIVAPGGLEVVTPEAVFSERVTITGLLSWLGGMVGSTASGVAAKITGAIEFLGTLTANGKRIDDTHTHKGVKAGGDNSGEVN